MSTLILVHGAWHGAWCWDATVTALRTRGVVAHAVELPFTGFDDDVAEVVAAVAATDGDVVLCGHSYGGRVISVAVERSIDRVKHVVYVAAPVADERQTEAYARRHANRTTPATGYDIETARLRFFHRLPVDQGVAAASRLRPTDFRAPMTEGLASRVWRVLPSTYVVCTDDRAVEPALQREMAGNTRFVVELDSDHSPFLCAPQALAEILANVVVFGQPSRPGANRRDDHSYMPPASPVPPGRPGSTTG